jgi:ABC-type polysaccharide/polyol phosphate transport system ATPase subunit
LVVVASLTEVGTVLTVKWREENIFLNAILWMTKRNCFQNRRNHCLSGCERYIDTLLKRYSSGMTAIGVCRFAF